MLTEAAAELFKFSTGLDDKAMAKLHLGLEKLHNNTAKTITYQIVAEVVKSEACFAAIEVGNRLVFDPFLNPQKSTGDMCLYACFLVSHFSHA